MERALELFLEDFIVWKKATISEYKKAKTDFLKLKTAINNQEITKEFKDSIYMCQHKLFQISYMFMEAHLRFHNIIGWYTEEQQKEINSYHKIIEKVKALLSEISEYIKDIELDKNLST